MEGKQKKGSIWSIVVFFGVFSLISNIFDESGLVYIPFLLIFGFIGVIGYITKKANEKANRNQKDDVNKDIFEKKEESFNEKKYDSKIKKKYPNKDYQSAGHDYSHRCPKCKTLISSKDKVCPECGMIQKNTVKCKTCGHVNPTGNVVCENCNDFLF